MKTPKQLERYFKGVANHRRIEILLLVAQKPDLSVEQIAKELDCNIKTISEHTKRLVTAGLLSKKYVGRSVVQNLTPYGQNFIKVFKMFE